MNVAIETLLKHPQIWRGKRASWIGADCIATGFADLDTQLPGGGWPSATLTEILVAQHGIGEMRVLLPALARLHAQKKWIALIAPPYHPFAPAWQAYGLDLSRVLWVHSRGASQALWAVEQALRAGTCGAVLSWPTAPSFQSLRRLQLAAESGQSWGILFRPLASASEATPAAVRVRLAPQDRGLSVHVLKPSGAWNADAVQIPLPLSRVVS